MNVRAPVPQLAEGPRPLDADASRYLCRVLRLREGDTFVAFDPSSRLEAEAVVEVASGDAALVRIGAVHAARVVAAAPLVLVYALAKGDKVDAVVRDATELGATRIVLAKTARAISKVDDDRAATKLDRWKRIAEQAARQCGRADPPDIAGVLPWRDALVAGAADVRFCLWENATAPLGPALLDAVARGAGLAFAIGPEGGLTEQEVSEAAALDYAAMSLGPFVLRTETVPAAVLGAVRVVSTT